MYITLLDEDDNPPRFARPFFQAVITETAPPQSSVIELIVLDEDEGENAEYFFQETGGGDPSGTDIHWSLYFKTTHGSMQMWSYIASFLEIL